MPWPPATRASSPHSTPQAAAAPRRSCPQGWAPVDKSGAPWQQGRGLGEVTVGGLGHGEQSQPWWGQGVRMKSNGQLVELGR